MNSEELLRYVRLKREKEMGVILNDNENEFLSKIDKVYNSDSEIKKSIDMLLDTNSLRDAYNVLDGNLEVSNELPSVEQVEKNMMNNTSQIDDVVNSNIVDDVVIPNRVQIPDVEDGGRQFTKRAGFIDVLILSLVTGFIGGVATTILFMMI